MIQKLYVTKEYTSWWLLELASLGSYFGVKHYCFKNLVVGIPLYGYLQMRTHAAKLHKIEVKEQLGFLYNGFRDNTYFWEIYIMYRKVLFVAV